MAKWWELAIPVVGTLGGVVVTATFQLANSIRQRHHDRGLKFVEEKRAVYAQFLRLVDDYKRMVVAREEVDRLIKKHQVTLDEILKQVAQIVVMSREQNFEIPSISDELREQVEPFISEVERGSSAESIEVIHERLAVLQERAHIFQQEVASTRGTLDGDGSLIDEAAKKMNEVYYSLELIASTKVQRAANALSKQAFKDVRSGGFNRARTSFLMASRGDLGIK